MDFKRNKTYHDILSEQREAEEGHLIPNPPLRWLAAGGSALIYVAALMVLYKVSDVAFIDRADPGDVPTWKHFLGLVLNTSAIGFSAIFTVSLVLWAFKLASPKFPLVFGVLGFFAGLLVAIVL